MAPLRRSTPPEILAPAGGRPQIAAAIEGGADAVYFGLTRFNARARAANFRPAELNEIMGQLHERGVRGFVTLNTLVFDSELSDVEEYVQTIVDCNVDAVIVQDLGLCARIRELYPELRLHGSTQMTVTSAESAELVGRLGCERVVLGRELSVRDIAAVAQGTDLELEAFVHGALCVSYSGQCFSSEAWGGRSANRGQCAQACRLPYDLVVDGKNKELDASYLLSPQDLSGLHHVEALMDAGVACFKIEGRLKGPEYVAATTQAYRTVVDAVWAGRDATPSDRDVLDLQQVFSRGLTPGFLEGPRHQRLVRGFYPNKRGPVIGTVTDVHNRKITIELTGPLRVGDGVLVGTVGGSVHTLLVLDEVITDEVASVPVIIKFGPKVRIHEVNVGDTVWRTRDARLDGRLKPLWDGGIVRRAKVEAQVYGRLGEPLRISFGDASGLYGSAVSERPLEAASKRALDAATLTQQLGRLGGTPLELASVEVDLEGDLFLPVSELNRVRRAAADALLEARRGATVDGRLDRPSIVPSLGGAGPLPPLPEAPARLSLLCRSLAQVEAAVQLDALDEVAVDFLEVKGLGEAIATVQAAGKRAIAVSPRVLKPNEENIRRFLLKLGADAILVRSLGLLKSLLDVDERPELYGDFSLNAANQRTAQLLMDAGLARLAPTHDLDAAQLCDLGFLGDGWGGRLELIAHHHLPIFHTEHCVFARFLSDGDDKTDCGTPCEHHEVHLRGPDGHDHLVLADIGCRNTVFNSSAQSALRSLSRFTEAGYKRFRIELVDHTPDEVAPLVAAYDRALRGELLGGEAWAQLRAWSRFELTAGSLQVMDQERELKRPAWMD